MAIVKVEVINQTKGSVMFKTHFVIDDKQLDWSDKDKHISSLKYIRLSIFRQIKKLINSIY